MTGLQLISSALRLTGCISPGDSIPNDEATDALEIANEMIDSFTAERLMIFSILRSTFTLVVNQQVYTLGTGGDVNMPRPPRIEQVSIIQQPLATQPLELPMAILNYEQWQQIPVKNTPTNLPQAVYPDYAFPLINLNFWGVPTAPQQIALYTWTILTQFPDLITEIRYPQGYPEMLRYNLGIRLAPEWIGQPANPWVIQYAAECKARIKSMNIVPMYLTCDPALVNPKGGQYNWISDAPAGIPS
jgi:hypothetical protein